MIVSNELKCKKREYDSQNLVRDKDELRKRKVYAGHDIIAISETSEVIQKYLSSDTPAMIARFGENELRTMISGLFDDYPVHFWKRHLKNVEYDGIFMGAGVFPRNVNLIPRFALEMKKSCNEVDMLACWYNKYEDFVVENFCSQQIRLCLLRGLEPYFNMNNPWTKALKDRKVLVVHPFAESIAFQYKRRKELFPNPELLPTMDLKIYKAVQTIAKERDKRFRNWFEALDFMHCETQKIDYEIAIVGCGAYGFPLAARMKRDGKKVIHLGGATQTMFGIMGQRWEDDPKVMEVRNDYWIYPSEGERPKNLYRVEGGCYW